MKVIAIEPVNGKQIGEELEVSEREAQQMVDKGLVKMLGDVQNKMKAAPANKAAANPSKAAGEATTSSASRAARASVSKTAKKSGAGKKAAKAAE